MNKTFGTRALAFIGAATVALTLSSCNSDELDRFFEEIDSPSSSSSPVEVVSDGATV